MKNELLSILNLLQEDEFSLVKLDQIYGLVEKLYVNN
jgi:hypothetical protein